MRKMEDTPDSESWSVNMCSNLEECQKGVLAQLFGPEEISEIIFDELKLPRHPGNDLPQKKVLSMTKKN